MAKMRFYNATEEAVPPYSVLMITGTQQVGSDKILKIEKPDTSAANSGYILNGPTSIPEGRTGEGVVPVASGWAFYDTGETPAIGEQWGAADGTWKLTKDGLGFQIIGAADSENERVLVRTIGANQILLVEMTETVGPGKAGNAKVIQITNDPDTLASGDTITLDEADPAQSILVVNFRPNFLATGVAYLAHKMGAFWVVENDACFQDFMT